MSLPTLLKAVGIHVPRYVTVDGQVVLDSTSATSGVLAPRQVEPHRFHGGEDPAPDRIDFSSAWWSQDPDAAERDKVAMRLAFPKFVGSSCLRVRRRTDRCHAAFLAATWRTIRRS